MLEARPDDAEARFDRFVGQAKVDERLDQPLALGDSHRQSDCHRLTNRAEETLAVQSRLGDVRAAESSAEGHLAVHGKADAHLIIVVLQEI